MTEKFNMRHRLDEELDNEREDIRNQAKSNILNEVYEEIEQRINALRSKSDKTKEIDVLENLQIYMREQVMKYDV